MLSVIKASLWNETESFFIEQDVFEEMKKHAIHILPTSILNSLSMTDELRKTWKQYILIGITYNSQCRYMQSQLPIGVPYVILKGTSAAQYYPHPEYRLLGDIDIITRREDFQVACKELLDNGFKENLSHDEEGVERHRCFSKNGIIVEMHSYFSILNDPKQAEYLDNLIIDNINSSHILPDRINGLVLLEHISQHLEHGLGFRQIIDWMMFVDKCLSDDEWPKFQVLAQGIGLEKLAVITTRMCEIYLGLPTRKWSAGADEDICSQLMNYVFSCGNFGNKRRSESDIGKNVFSRMRSPKSIFVLLQERGLVNWKVTRKHPVFRPFAWMYQTGRYFRKGLWRYKATSKLKDEYMSAKKRTAMFDLLGVKQTSKGLVVFRDGKYVKE